MKLFEKKGIHFPQVSLQNSLFTALYDNLQTTLHKIEPKKTVEKNEKKCPTVFSLKSSSELIQLS